MNMKHVVPPSLTKLVSSWLTVSLLFVSGQAVLLYGALAGLLIIGSFFTAFFLSIPFLSLLNARDKDSPVLAVLNKALFLESFSIHFFIVCLIFDAALSYIPTLSLISILVILFFLILFLGKKVDIITTLKMALLLSLAILLPNYNYLQKGLETVYHNLLHYHPKFLHLEQNGALLLFFLLVATFFSKFIVQLPLLEKYVEVQLWRGLRKILIGTFIWATIILAFSTMTLVSFTHIRPLEFERNFFMMLDNQMGKAFIMTVLLCLIISSLIEMYGACRIIKRTRGHWKALLIGIGAILGGYYYFSEFSIFYIFLAFGGGMFLLCILHLLSLIHHKNIKIRKINANE